MTDTRFWEAQSRGPQAGSGPGPLLGGRRGAQGELRAPHSRALGLPSRAGGPLSSGEVVRPRHARPRRSGPPLSLRGAAVGGRERRRAALGVQAPPRRAAPQPLPGGPLPAAAESPRGRRRPGRAGLQARRNANCFPLPPSRGQGEVRAAGPRARDRRGPLLPPAGHRARTTRGETRAPCSPQTCPAPRSSHCPHAGSPPGPACVFHGATPLS